MARGVLERGHHESCEDCAITIIYEYGICCIAHYTTQSVKYSIPQVHKNAAKRAYRNESLAQYTAII